MELVLYKKKYSLKQGYHIFVKAIRLLPTFRRAKKNGILSESFIKRIMLAVTEVNGCEVCSYEHAKTALELGMTEAEIHKLLSGDHTQIPADQGKAIFFAQHYADTEGEPSVQAWEEIIDHYGKVKAEAILSATRIIMFGNCFGLALSALKSRMRGERIEGSSLGYEVGMLASLIFIIPIGSLQALLEALFKKPLI